MTVYYGRNTTRSPGYALESVNGSTAVGADFGYTPNEAIKVQARIGTGAWADVAVVSSLTLDAETTKTTNVTCGSTSGNLEIRRSDESSARVVFVPPPGVVHVIGNVYSVVLCLGHWTETDADNWINLLWGTSTQVCSITGTFGSASVAPIVTTSAASSVVGTSATGNGDVTSDGGATITERGVCWGTSANPVASGNHAIASGTTGAFTASMTGLAIQTTYHYRAYAINSVGTSYGADTTFTTILPAPIIGTLSIDGSGIVTIPLTGVAGVPRLYRHGAGSFAQVVDLSYCWLDLHDNGGGSWTIRTRLPWTGTDPIPLGATGYFRATNFTSGLESSASSTASIVASVDKSVAESRWLDSFDTFTATLGGVDTTTSYTANPLLARAYLYYLRPNSTRLGYVSAQWTYAKAHRSTSTDSTHVLNWWYNQGAPGGYQSIDNGGRSAWHVYQTAQILKRAGETTLSADMLACVDAAAYAYFNVFGDYSYYSVYGSTVYTGPQGRTVNYHWRNGGAGVDAPNQLLWFASLLSMLYHDSSSAYYQYAASIPYIQYAIDFAWAAQYASGYIPWTTSSAGRYSGYHLASVEALTAIRRAWGVGWYAHLDTVLASAAAWSDADVEPNCGYWEDGQTYPVTYGLGIIAAQFCRAYLGISDPMDGFGHSAAFLTSANATIYSFGNEVAAYPPQADSAQQPTVIVHELGIRSALLTGPPPAPGNFTVAYSAGSVGLAWTKNGTDETGFAIQRSVDGGAYAAFSTPAANATTATDSTVSAGHTYRYRIAAVNASGQSAWVEGNQIMRITNAIFMGTNF